MPHLLMAKYTTPARAQTHANTAIPLFIVPSQSLLIQHMVLKRSAGEAGPTKPKLNLGKLSAR
jgi:hypothetical protein